MEQRFLCSAPASSRQRSQDPTAVSRQSRSPGLAVTWRASSPSREGRSPRQEPTASAWRPSSPRQDQQLCYQKPAQPVTPEASKIVQSPGSAPPQPATPVASKIVQSSGSAPNSPRRPKLIEGTPWQDQSPRQPTTASEASASSRDCVASPSGCIQRISAQEQKGLDGKWQDRRLVGQVNGADQVGSPVSRSVDLSVAVLGGLPSVQVDERAAECTRRRGRIRTAIGFLDKVLDESSEAIKLKPSKNDRLTAQNYHACYRHLHWSLGRCMQMQELSEMLENYDSGRFDPWSGVSAEYAQLSVDICMRHDRGLLLLTDLCQSAEAEEKELAQEKVSNPIQDAFQIWLASLTGACSSRRCLGDAYCTGARTETQKFSAASPPLAPLPLPSAYAIGVGLLGVVGWTVPTVVSSRGETRNGNTRR